MRDREDYLKNLGTVRTHLLILTEDIKYPLSEERQQWLDGANTLIRFLYNAEMKDEIMSIMQDLEDGE